MKLTWPRTAGLFRGVLILAFTATGASAAPTVDAPEPAAASPEWTPPDGSSKKPTDAEWKDAAPLALRRPHRDCTAESLREWVRLTCHRPRSWEPYLGVRVIGGPHEDVSVIDPPKPKAAKRTGGFEPPDQHGVHVVFPVRRGDRRLIEISEMLPLAWKSWQVEENLAVTISALWLPDAAHPTVTVY